MMEAVLIRSPKGAPVSHRIVLKENPKRVIYQRDADGASYLGTVTHAGFKETNGRGGEFIEARKS